MKWKIKYQNANGGIEQMVVTADSEKEVFALAREKELRVTDVSKKMEMPFSNNSNKKISDQELEELCIQFRQMSSAGIDFMQALEIIFESSDEHIAKVIKQIWDDLRSGKTMEEAFSKHDVFDSFFLSTLKTGQHTGNLTVAFGELESNFKFRRITKGKVMSVMIYPFSVMAVAIGVFFVAVLKILPAFANLYRESEASLPWVTQFLLSIGDFIFMAWPYLLVGTIASVIGFIKYVKTPKGAIAVDKLIVKTPIFGSLIRKVALSKFMRALSSSLKSGIPIMEAMHLAVPALGNRYLIDQMKNWETDLRSGKTISKTLSDSKIFYKSDEGMFKIGEMSGRLHEMIDCVTDIKVENVQHTVEVLPKKIDPFITIFLAVIVGTIGAAIYLPVFQASSVQVAHFQKHKK